MTSPQSESALKQRLEFIELDDEARKTIRELKPVITDLLGGALDKFYAKVARTPAVARFFSDKALVTSAKKRQEGHWANLANGSFDDSYVNGVTAVGKTHARIGLDPRWYIGGYALIIENIVRSIIANELKGFFTRGKSEKLGNDISAVIKAALVDMDYAISVYLDVLADERQRVFVGL